MGVERRTGRDRRGKPDGERYAARHEKQKAAVDARGRTVVRVRKTTRKLPDGMQKKREDREKTQQSEEFCGVLGHGMSSVLRFVAQCVDHAADFARSVVMTVVATVEKREEFASHEIEFGDSLVDNGELFFHNVVHFVGIGLVVMEEQACLRATCRASDSAE